MEFPDASLPLFFAFLLFSYVIVKKKRKSKPQRPPGPRTLPLFGNLHQLMGLLPHRAMTDLAKKYGPIMHLQLGEVPVIVVSSPEVAKAVMMTNDLKFADRAKPANIKLGTYNFTDIAFAPYGDYWKQLRKICRLELLSIERVQSFSSLRGEEVHNLIESIALSSGAPVNITEKLNSMTNGLTAIAAFGRKCKHQDEFLSLLREGLRTNGGFNLLYAFPSLKVLHWISGANNARILKRHQRFDKIYDDIIDEHQARRKSDRSGEEDLVDVLLKVQESGDLEIPLTKDNIKAVIQDVFIAGTETVSSAVEWAMSELIREPATMKKAQAEVREILQRRQDIDEADIKKMHYLKMVIKETLRMHSPPLLPPREAREACEINGYELPVKTSVIINAWAISRDPRYWENAECFKPERFEDSPIDFKGANFEYIPFGAGRRICPGMYFGMATVELTLSQLLYHFDWKLPNGAKPEQLDMTEDIAENPRRKHDLHVIATPYVP